MKITKKSYLKSEIEGNKDIVGVLKEGYNPETGEGYIKLSDGSTLALIKDDETGLVYPFLRKKGSAYYEFKSEVMETEDKETLYFFRKESRGVAKKDVVSGNDGSVSVEELMADLGEDVASQLIADLQKGHLSANQNEKVYARVTGKLYFKELDTNVDASTAIVAVEKSIQEVTDDAWVYVATKIRESICAKYGKQTKEEEGTLKVLENIERLIDANADKDPSLKRASEMTAEEIEDFRQRCIKFYAWNVVGKSMSAYLNDLDNIHDKEKEMISDEDILYLEEMAEDYINTEVVLVGNKEQERLKLELSLRLYGEVQEGVENGRFAELTKEVPMEQIESKYEAAAEYAKQLVDSVLSSNDLVRLAITPESVEALYDKTQRQLLNSALQSEEKNALFTLKFEKEHSKKEVVDIQAKIAKEVAYLKGLLDVPQAKELGENEFKKSPFNKTPDKYRVIALADNWAREFVKDPANGYIKDLKNKDFTPDFYAQLNEKARELRDHVLDLVGGIKLEEEKEEAPVKDKKDLTVAKKIVKWGGIGLGVLALATGVAGGLITLYPNDEALEDSRNQGRVYAEGFDADHLTVHVNDKETPVSVEVSGLSGFKAGELKYDRAIHVGAAREAFRHEYTNKEQDTAVEKIAQIVADEAKSEGIVVGKYDRKSGNTVVSTIYPLDGEYEISGDVTSINERQKFVDKLIAEGVSTKRAQELTTIYDRAFSTAVGDDYLTQLYVKDDGKDPGKDPVKPQDKFDLTKFDYSAIAGAPVTYVGLTTEEDVITREQGEAGNIRILDFADGASTYETEEAIKAADCTVARYINMDQLFAGNEDADYMKELLGIDAANEGIYVTPNSFHEGSTSNGRRCINVNGVIITEDGEGKYNADYQKFGRVAARTSGTAFDVEEAAKQAVLSAVVEDYSIDPDENLTYTPADKVSAEDNKDDEKVF